MTNKLQISAEAMATEMTKAHLSISGETVELNEEIVSAMPLMRALHDLAEQCYSVEEFIVEVALSQRRGALDGK